MDRQQLYLGTSGLVLPYKNRQAYPLSLEGKSRLNIYGTLFNSIEINSIFYKLPKASTIGQWVLSVGGDFRFTFKLWKEITHSPNLEFDQAALEQYFEVITGAGNNPGCILIQFPASVRYPMLKKVASLLSELQLINHDRWSVAVEFRSPSWYCEPTYDMLNTYNTAMVFHDKSGSASPHPELYAPHTYLRFHGPEGNYKGSYDQGFLFEYAGYIVEWLRAGKVVYVYFNNTMGGALDNLRTLKKILHDDFQIV
ncbi:DUF72 domain-containing protein [Taibaiella koreensis]|uniref:DUF72 domain-containing protein n=1 Tax=Taibaiella koreensis TaxID=1268548 RepID=UPI0013C2B8D6|nr:DUF72 domain-containing protein [Taibaiella koreensis]